MFSQLGLPRVGLQFASRLGWAKESGLPWYCNFMSGPQPSVGYRVLVVSQDALLPEELRIGLYLQNGQERHGAQAPAGGAAEEQTERACRLEHASDTQTAVALTRAARATGKPYLIAFVGVDGSSRESSLHAAASLWEIDPDLEVVLCAGEADCAWAEKVGRGGCPGHTAVLSRPVAPLHARQLARALVMNRCQILSVDPATEVAVGSGDRSLERHRERMPTPHLDLLAEDVATALKRILTDFKQRLEDPQAHSPTVAEIDKRRSEITWAVHRAANLVSQLAILGCDGSFAGEEVDLNQLLARGSMRLQWLLQGLITVETRSGAVPTVVKAEAPWIEQLIADLGVLATQGSFGGGKLRLSTGEPGVVGEPASQHVAVPAGFVRLTVEYHKPELPPAAAPALARCAGPPVQGTGLEWEVAEAIVRQHDGQLRRPPVSNGSVNFEVLLPAVEEVPPAAEGVRPTLQEARPANAGTTPEVREESRGRFVLVVEDDEAVRQVTGMALEDCGCRVVEASDSAEALRLWEEHREALDLLIVDLVIPGLVDGLQLAARMRSERPNLKVILTTGFADDGLASELDGTPGFEFLPKPYTCTQMQRVLARCLEHRGAQLRTPSHAQ